MGEEEVNINNDDLFFVVWFIMTTTTYGMIGIGVILSDILLN